jgi:hypothetical protein
MQILAIDPGNEQSAYVIYDADSQIISEKGIEPNDRILARLELVPGFVGDDSPYLVIEQVACMGMAVGAEVFETVFWSGRFAQSWAARWLPWNRIKRHQVKMHLCGSMRAKDGNIRQALIDRFGKPGTKKNPGKTYGLSGDMWQALAVAVTYAELPSTSAEK